MTTEANRELNNRRNKGVRDAWKQEQGYVKEGRGTRNWSLSQQQRILKKGKAWGYVAHHMKSVSKYNNYADDGHRNIQFLTPQEHIAAHRQGITKEKGYRRQTNGRYDTEKGKTRKFIRSPRPPKVKELTQKINMEQSQGQQQSKAKKRELKRWTKSR